MQPMSYNPSQSLLENNMRWAVPRVGMGNQQQQPGQADQSPWAKYAPYAAGAAGLGVGAASSKGGGGLSSWLFGQPESFDRVNSYSDEQNGLHDQLIQGLQGAPQMGLDWIRQILGGGDNAFADFEAPYKRQFERETVPGIAERFAGMGNAPGAQNSSALQNSLSQAGSDLSTNLAGLRANLKNSALGQLQNFLGQSQQPRFENVHRPATQGLFGGILNNFANGAGQAVFGGA